VGAEGDREMRAFLALGPVVRWDRVHLDGAPYATLVRTKMGHQRHVPIAQSIVKTLKALPSHGSRKYGFDARTLDPVESQPPWSMRTSCCCVLAENG
jgi:hypothetical protein